MFDILKNSVIIADPKIKVSAFHFPALTIIFIYRYDGETHIEYYANHKHPVEKVVEKPISHIEKPKMSSTAVSKNNTPSVKVVKVSEVQNLPISSNAETEEQTEAQTAAVLPTETESSEEDSVLGLMQKNGSQTEETSQNSLASRDDPMSALGSELQQTQSTQQLSEDVSSLSQEVSIYFLFL